MSFGHVIECLYEYGFDVHLEADGKETPRVSIEGVFESEDTILGAIINMVSVLAEMGVEMRQFHEDIDNV